MFARKRSSQHSMESIWYFAASCIFLFLFGNLVMLRSYHEFVKDDDFSNGARLETENGHETLSPKQLASRNSLQQTHEKGNQYYAVENRVRKLLENPGQSVFSIKNINHSNYTANNKNVTKSLLFRHLEMPSPTVPSGMLNCNDIADIKDKVFIASGWTKAVFRGVYHRGQVALKTVDVGGQDVSSCLYGGLSLQQCYQRAARKIIKEILLLRELSHKNVIQVLGFCVPDRPYDGEAETAVVMVTELGDPIDLIKLLQMTWEARLRISYDMTKLLHFLSQSARGTMVMNDFRRQQFVLVDGTLKLSDVDDAGFEEPQCTSDTQCILGITSSNFTKRFPCKDGRCQGYNEYLNMHNAGRHFTTFLLPHGAPRGLRPLITRVVSAYGNCSLTSRQLVLEMDNIVQLYRAGTYLNRSLPEQRSLRYRAVKRSDMPGQYDYRCRIAGGMCTMSVFDQREAEDLCDNDPDCKGLVWTHKRTWTGEHI